MTHAQMCVMLKDVIFVTHTTQTSVFNVRCTRNGDHFQMENVCNGWKIVGIVEYLENVKHVKMDMELMIMETVNRAH